MMLRYLAWVCIEVLFVIPANMSNVSTVMKLMDDFKFKNSTVVIAASLYNFAAGICLSAFFAWIMLG